MENNNEGNKEEPLLYIHQPKFQRPARKMQDSFLSEDVKENVQMENNVQQEVHKKQTFTIPPLGSENMIEVVQEIPEEKQEEVQKPVSAADYFRRNPGTSSRKSWNLTPVKPFRDMSILEKLQYLSGFPSSQQPYPCEFITESKRYRGTLSKFEHDRIAVKNSQGDVNEVDVKDLQAIRIII
ncbi:spore coat CotO family protein [Lederbergia panacisoli]|uniref:spore coat CotO family protein n=1 Tax=Lederbergia panacisoli TaxID=1255251 RepID=UPI00214BF0F5|nr:spore coat CotO family protein [Lederbergia panacisoli]MCR2820974.1 spore coat CotO family protein [Lederbergia panacisoli]